MNCKVKISLATAALVTLMTTANAGDIAVGVTAGTMGAGATASIPLAESLNARVNITGFSYKYSGSSGVSGNSLDTDVSYDVKLKMLGVGALADWYPFDGHFRVTGGAYYNGNKLDLDAKPNGVASYTLNGHTYTTAQVGALKGEVKYNKVAPYIGIGGGNPLSKSGNWSLGWDIGAMYTGSPKSSLSATDATAGTLLANDIKTEEAKLKENADKVKWWPVIALSVSYRF